MILGSSTKDIEKILIRQSGGGVSPSVNKRRLPKNSGSQLREATAYGWINLKLITGYDCQENGNAAERPNRNQGCPN